MPIRRRWLLGVVALVFPTTTALAVGYADEAQAPPRQVRMIVNEADHPASTAPAPIEAPRPATEPVIGAGAASYYASRFGGQPTASGELFDNDALTAAHPSLPFGSKVRVTNVQNGQSVIVRINDRGPFHSSRVIDVSQAAARELGLMARGQGQVRLSLPSN